MRTKLSEIFRAMSDIFDPLAPVRRMIENVGGVADAVVDAKAKKRRAKG